MLTALKGSGTDMECKPPSAFGFGRNYEDGTRHGDQ